MNKLKQGYKTFLTKWKDNTLYKTSLTKSSTLFRTKVTMLIFLTIGVFDLLISNWLGATICYMITTCTALILSAVYKEVAVSVEEDESK